MIAFATGSRFDECREERERLAAEQLAIQAEAEDIDRCRLRHRRLMLSLFAVFMTCVLVMTVTGIQTGMFNWPLSLCYLLGSLGTMRYGYKLDQRAGALRMRAFDLHWAKAQLSYCEKQAGYQ